MTYLIGLGWDRPLNELAAVDPQPRNGEIQTIERRYGDDGLLDVGPFSQPTWDVFDSDEELQSIFTQFGLDIADEARVTWWTRDDTFTWHRYNGIAVKPKPVEEGGRQEYFLRDYGVTIKIVAQLEEV